jgi:4-hydroxy-2-oxoheptanedioate aldolase
MPGLLALVLTVAPSALAAQGPGRLNPMIALHEQGLPVFGMTHPAITAGRGRRGAPEGQADATPAPEPSLTTAASETLAWRMSDFEYDSFSPANAERFLGYLAALIAAGGSGREHAFISKIPIVREDPTAAAERIRQQLDAGHAGVMMQEVESAEEVRQAIAAMRFRSRGGTRPEEGIGLAAAWWGVSREEYLAKADVWPLNPEGELVLWVIIESRKGVENVREIAAVPGVGVVTVGAGTLGGVFSSTNAAGERVRDQAGFDAAVAKVLAACKELDVPCSYPANNPADIDRLMDMGFEVFTMQRRNEDGFAAIEHGRKRAGRPLAR